LLFDRNKRGGKIVSNGCGPSDPEGIMSAAVGLAQLPGHSRESRGLRENQVFAGMTQKIPLSRERQK
jgi:hypothetical protein